MKTKILASIALSAALLLASLSFTQTALEINTLREAKDRLLAAGFSCTPGSFAGDFGNGFLVSRVAVTWSEANYLRKVGVMGPDWEGKIWVTVQTAKSQLETLPDDCGLSIWGRVIAFGDRAFLHEVDEALRTNGSPPEARRSSRPPKRADDGPAGGEILPAALLHSARRGL